MLRILSVLTAVALHTTAAPAPVALIPVEGEGAAYWPRWRGPSGQGHVAGTNYVGHLVQHQERPMEGSGPRPGPFLADRLEGSPLPHDRARRRLEGIDARVPAAADGALLWETDVPTSGVERAYRKNSHASATPATDGAARLRIVRHARARRVRLRRHAGVAAEARRPRATITAAPARRCSTRTASSSTRITAAAPRSGRSSPRSTRAPAT